MHTAISCAELCHGTPFLECAARALVEAQQPEPAVRGAHALQCGMVQCGCGLHLHAQWIVQDGKATGEDPILKFDHGIRIIQLESGVAVQILSHLLHLFLQAGRRNAPSGKSGEQ